MTWDIFIMCNIMTIIVILDILFLKFIFSVGIHIIKELLNQIMFLLEVYRSNK